MAELATISERAQEALEDLPPHLADSDLTQRLVNTVALEFQRIEDFLTTVRDKLRPQNADDEYGTLELWERLLEIPVNPPVSVNVRRARVIAALKRLTTGIGEGWTHLITVLLQSSNWTHDENNPNAYELTITIPYPSTSFQAGQLEALLERISPAHLQLDISYSDAFRVGISQVGDPL